MNPAKTKPHPTIPGQNLPSQEELPGIFSPPPPKCACSPSYSHPVVALTITAVGVAKPRLHGHATRQTSTARRAPRAQAEPPPSASATAGKADAAAADADAGSTEPRRDGDRVPQKTSVEADAAKTSQVNLPAMASASRWTGTLRACCDRVGV